MERMALSVKETCDTLGISRSTIYRLIGDGQLRTVHIGRRCLIPRTEIDRLLDGPSTGRPGVHDVDDGSAAG